MDSSRQADGFLAPDEFIDSPSTTVSEPLALKVEGDSLDVDPIIYPRSQVDEDSVFECDADKSFFDDFSRNFSRDRHVDSLAAQVQMRVKDEPDMSIASEMRNQESVTLHFPTHDCPSVPDKELDGKFVWSCSPVNETDDGRQPTFSSDLLKTEDNRELGRIKVEPALLCLYGNKPTIKPACPVALYRRTPVAAPDDPMAGEIDANSNEDDYFINKPSQCESPTSPTTSGGTAKPVFGERLFSCSVCNFKTTRGSYLATHIMNRHSTAKPYKCSLCGFAYARKSSLCQHMSIHLKTFKCSECEYRTGHKWSLCLHMRTHTGEKPFKCLMCDYKTAHKQNLGKHARKHLASKQRSRLDRGSNGINPSAVAEHSVEKLEETTHNIENDRYKRLHVDQNKCITYFGEKTQKCVKCNFMSNSQQEFTGHCCRENVHKCSLCEYTTGHKSSLTRHKRMHLGEAPYECSRCESKFATNYSLINHFKIHIEEKNYACSRCEYKARIARSVSGHNLTHTDCCSVCEYKPSSRENFIEHMKTHSKAHSCPHCEFISIRKDDLIRHLRTHSGERPYACTMCDYRSAQSSTLTTHMRTHTGEKPFKCSLCDYTTAHKQNLGKHTRKHLASKQHSHVDRGSNGINPSAVAEHSVEKLEETTHNIENDRYKRLHVEQNKCITYFGEKTQKCVKCNFMSDSQQEFTGHYCRENVHKCSLCEYTTGHKSSLTRHKRMHPGEAPYECSLCESKFATNYSLINHFKIHIEEKNYACSRCEYKARTARSISGHNLTHTDCCSLCEYKPSSRENFIEHMKTHSKAYSCPHCEFISIRKDDLIRHMRTHSGERPYACTMCDYRSAQSSTLTTHMRTHTGEKPFKCSLCDFKSAKKNGLTRHMKTHFRQNPY